MGTMATSFLDVLTEKKLWKDRKQQNEAKHYIRNSLCPLGFDGLNEQVKKSFPKKDHHVTVHKQERRAHADLVAAVLKRLDVRKDVMDLHENKTSRSL